MIEKHKKKHFCKVDKLTAFKSSEQNDVNSSKTLMIKNLKNEIKMKIVWCSHRNINLA